MSPSLRFAALLLSALVCWGCGDPRRSESDAGLPDVGTMDSDRPDAMADADGRDAGADDGAVDAAGDGALTDSGADSASADSGVADSGVADSGVADSGVTDSGVTDSGVTDSGVADSGVADSGIADSRVPDASTGACISGATGTHALRFRWNGTTSGSRAWVSYEANTLPDTSRWHVSAASSSIGYSPVFRDPFLGEGGLDLSGTVFIDVELSTAGLSSLSNVTIAVYGRSFNTTASGSFRWQSFSGTGASPSGGVANSAPYEWYGADATAALPAGDDGILLRLRAGGPSNSLVVNQVEVCFDAS